MRYVLFYESADRPLRSRAPLHFEAHRAWWTGFHERGELLLVGPFSDRSGAMSVFTTAEVGDASSPRAIRS